MELHALEWNLVIPRAHAHELVFPRLRRHLDGLGHRLGCDHERVIARRDERVLDPDVHALLVVKDLRRLAVHDSWRSHDPATEDQPDALMPEAHTEDRRLAREP